MVFLLNLIKPIPAAFRIGFPYVGQHLIEAAHCPIIGMASLGKLENCLIFKLPLAGRTIFPCIISAPRYFERALAVVFAYNNSLQTILRNLYSNYIYNENRPYCITAKDFLAQDKIGLVEKDI